MNGSNKPSSLQVRWYLLSADSDDPGRRDDDSRVSAEGTRLIDFLQHEAGHLVVIL